MIFSLPTLALAALATSATAIPTFGHWQPKPPTKCPIIFDGRVSTHATPLTFDDPLLSPYNTKNVKGENLTWSSILHLPPKLLTGVSRFDIFTQHRPVEVTLDNNSIFRGGGKLQYGFRRAGLLLKDDVNAAGGDKADNGTVTFHWSVKQDLLKGLNLTHEYMNVWHERADYAGNQFTFSMGLLLPGDGGDGINTRQKRESFRVQDNKNKILWETPIAWLGWQNFAVQLDYVKDTIRVFYSKGDTPLKAVTKALPNDNSGGGQLQLGMAKKPTETETVVFDGYQEVMRHKEGQIYGGVFVEDSTNGCIST